MSIEFNHPYNPYAIQQQFMESLHAVLDESSIGIFESPTGTGKTLSLVCGAMTWLRNNQSFDRVPNNESTEDISDLPEWFREQERAQMALERAASYKTMKEALNQVRKQELSKVCSEVFNPTGRVKRQRTTDSHHAQVHANFLPEEPCKAIRDHPGTNNFSKAVLDLLDVTDSPGLTDLNPLDIPYPSGRKIFFCSRTHSQLNQLAVELRKLSFQSGEHDTDDYGVKEPPRYVALASRKNLCINTSVSHLPLEELNEACLGLQETKTPSEKRCKYLTKDDTKVKQFRDNILASVRDIEELAALGTEFQICPYYSARSALPASEIVSMPYPLLLNKTARESLGIDLLGNVVIIDEAHNLVDAINVLFSASVTLSQIRLCQKHVELYLETYSRKLGGTNRTHIRQLSTVLAGMRSILESRRPQGEVSLAEILRKGADSVNINDLVNYLTHSKLARKVDGFQSSKRSGDGNSTLSTKQKTTPILTLVQRFINCLANTTSEGCLLMQRLDADEVALKYMLLDPANAFSDIVKQSHSVILAGGTMQPTDDITSLLFPLDSNKLRLFSYGHVIPKENLVAVILPKGPNGVNFNFNFDNRYETGMLRDLGTAILNFATIVPDGMVIFFPSYEYLDFVLSFWKSSGQMLLFTKKKSVFVETKEQTVEKILAGYCLAIHSGEGGILLAVIGGKMSEGINFSDSLGRAVFIIGLPFPNTRQPDWHARLNYIESKQTMFHKTRGATVAEALQHGKAASKQHYENVAMRAVNQSIGRAIRHEHDFAMIYLLDQRYSQVQLRSKLPAWIQNCLMPDTVGFGQAVRTTAAFFRSKRTP